MVIQNVSVKGVQRTFNRDTRALTDAITLGFANVTWTFYALNPTGAPIVRSTVTYDAVRGTVN